MKIILGTMNFGPQLDLEASRQMTEAFLKTGNNELDTAYVYNGGDTEKYLGSILPHLDGYYLATKVHPRITGKLDRECILMEFNESLKRMCRESVDLLYFHFPDGKTPVGEALETVAGLAGCGYLASVRQVWLSKADRLSRNVQCPLPQCGAGIVPGNPGIGNAVLCLQSAGRRHAYR